MDAQLCGGCSAPIGSEDNASVSSESLASPEVIETVSEGTRSDARLVSGIKTVTVLFSDIKDSTALIQALDAEDAYNLLSAFVATMTDAVKRFNGTVVNELGDGMMAVFGAPLSQEDHAVRGCLAALAISFIYFFFVVRRQTL